jgi:hypothetical protein
MRILQSALLVAVSLLLSAVITHGQRPNSADAAYIAGALSAAPKAIAKDAAVVRIENDGTIRTVRPGTNEFTCLALGEDNLCNDANAMEILQAQLKHAPPPQKMGITYMLTGDKGSSNTDPFADHKTPDNHWIVTGPHLMIFGPGVKTLPYTRAKDPDARKPYIMWAGTPYEHAMVPVE